MMYVIKIEAKDVGVRNTTHLVDETVWGMKVEDIADSLIDSFYWPEDGAKVAGIEKYKATVEEVINDLTLHFKGIKR